MKLIIITICFLFLLPVGGCKAADPNGIDNYHEEVSKAAYEQLRQNDPEKAIKLAREEAAQTARESAHNESMTKMRSMLTWMGGILIGAAVLLVLNKDISQAIICGCSAGSCFALVSAPDSWYQWIFIGIVGVLAVGMFMMSKRTEGGLFFGQKNEIPAGDN